ncbi:MAG: SoxR reducing system RseC family protein [Woeseiaceae bacterium]
MENPQGRVLTVDKQALAAVVEIAAAFSCARCAAGKGCGAGLFDSGRQSRRISANIAAGIDVNEGDEVSIELAPRHVLNAALIVYGTPLGGGLVGAILAYALGLGDLYAAIAALAGITAGIAIARRRAAHDLCQFTPTIVARHARH